MLSNPDLEHAIFRNYPFLTSASSLTQLAKRRARLMSCNPVSVTEMERYKWNRTTPRRDLLFIRHHMGYDLTVALCHPGPYPIEGITMHMDDIKSENAINLSITNRREVGSLITVDLLDLLFTEFPIDGPDAPRYGEIIGDNIRVPQPGTIEPTHLHVQEGMVLVVLSLGGWKRWNVPTLEEDGSLKIFEM